MLLVHILVLILVRCDDIHKLCDVVSLEADYSLHKIQVQWLGTNFKLPLKHKQHHSNCDRTTDVILHVLYVQIQIFLGGNLSQLLQVPFNLQSDLVPNFYLVSEPTNGILLVFIKTSKLLNSFTYGAWMYK